MGVAFVRDELSKVDSDWFYAGALDRIRKSMIVLAAAVCLVAWLRFGAQ
jgi:hypothetical protein